MPENVDYASNINTTGQIAVNGAETGVIGVVGDHDWLRVLLQGGTQYTVNVNGASSGAGTLRDPTVSVRNAAGAIIFGPNDDANQNGTFQSLDSRLIFTPTTSGNYFVDVGELADNEVGSYHVSIEAVNAEILFTAGNDTRSIPSENPRGAWYAGAGDDVVKGTNNSDIIYGGVGADTLIGGKEIALSAFQAQIYRLYRATLDRSPDINGIANWVDQLSRGVSLAQITTGFIRSSEFINQYGPAVNNRAFVTLLYQNVLGREPDLAGLNNWVRQLESGASRESVVLGFSESTENQQKSLLPSEGWASSVLHGQDYGDIYRLYGATLNREPDVSGMRTWVSSLSDGASMSVIAAGFINSQEFQTRYGNLDDTAFVTQLYQNVLRRAPDAGGLRNWVDQLRAGAQRQDVVLGFSNSTEYKNNTSAVLNAFMANVDGWGANLIGGADNDVLLGARGKNTFVFNAGDSTAAGHDDVYGLQPWDTISLRNFGYTSISQPLNRMQQNGGDVLFSDQNTNVVFHDTSISEIGRNPFSFA